MHACEYVYVKIRLYSFLFICKYKYALLEFCVCVCRHKFGYLYMKYVKCIHIATNFGHTTVKNKHSMSVYEICCLF